MNLAASSRWGSVVGLRLIVTALLLLPLAIFLQIVGGGYASDLNGADEASHYINGLLIHDYVAEGLPGNPIAYAIQYYIHFPKVAIGHWPPFFYVVEAAFFFPAGPSPATALLLQAVIAAGIAALVGLVIGGVDGWLAAAGGIAVLAAPEIFGGLNNVMSDAPLALLALFAALAWARYMFEQTATWSVAFALVAIAAILTKGDGFLLAFIPPLSIAFTGRLGLLRDWRFWLPAPIVAICTVPWYLATYHITADGFNYSWGLAFTAQALAAYGQFLLHLIGIPGLLFALVGAAKVLLDRDWTWEHAVGMSMLTLVVGGFAFHCLVPVAIESRYLAVIIPGLVILAFFGIDWIVRWFVVPRYVGLATACCLLVIGAGEGTYSTKTSLQMSSASAAILGATEQNPFILVGSDPNGEGAIIADVATRDRGRTHYVVRGFKVLGSGNWMGSEYHPRFAQQDQVQRWIEENRIGWVVIDTSPPSVAWTHNAQLRDVVAASLVRLAGA